MILRAALPFANWRGVANAVHVVDTSIIGHPLDGRGRTDKGLDIKE
jgi:hypothetical protein